MNLLHPRYEEVRNDYGKSLFVEQENIDIIKSMFDRRTTRAE
jgi:hypothetical protein